MLGSKKKNIKRAKKYSEPISTPNKLRPTTLPVNVCLSSTAFSTRSKMFFLPSYPTPLFSTSPPAFSWTHSFHFYTASTFSLSTASARTTAKWNFNNPPHPTHPHPSDTNTSEHAFPSVLLTYTMIRLSHKHKCRIEKPFSRRKSVLCYKLSCLTYVCKNTERGVWGKLPTDKNDFLLMGRKNLENVVLGFSFTFPKFFMLAFYVTGACFDDK